MKKSPNPGVEDFFNQFPRPSAMVPFSAEPNAEADGGRLIGSHAIEVSVGGRRSLAFTFGGYSLTLQSSRNVVICGSAVITPSSFLASAHVWSCAGSTTSCCTCADLSLVETRNTAPRVRSN